LTNKQRCSRIQSWT